MKIAFDMVNCGLANNGGTRTIVLCSKVLERLGHRCDIVGVSDKFTWLEHKQIIPCFPSDLDVVIATASTTVARTLTSNAPKKAWYIRAHESWVYYEKDLRWLYNAGLFNIVNSKGLQQQLAACGADSKVIYQGIDFDWWENRNLRPKNKIRIGCLHTTQPRKRWKDFAKLAKILGTEKYEYVGMGNSKPKEDFLVDFKHNPTVAELNDLYSSCHIWVATSENEGLHNAPMEAAMCGCLIVCGDEPLGGMIYDYAFKDNTALVYDRKDMEHAAELIRNPNWDCIERMYNCLKHNIGTREDNMKKLVELLL